MATSKKKTSASSTKKVKENIEEVKEEVKTPEKEVKTSKKEVKTSKKGPKFQIGDIVFVSKDAEAVLEGFNLFPQYKKYTYTVEAYDQNTGDYTLRRLNLTLKLKEELILAPDEKTGSALIQQQY